MSDTRNYRLVYPDSRTNEEEPSGGYVEVHLSHDSHETQLNIETAIVLAIDDSQGMKNPDAYLLREQIVIEFKHNQRPTASAIDNEIRDARRQADYIVLDVRSSIRKSDLCSGVINCMKAAPNVKKLWIIWRGSWFA